MESGFNNCKDIFEVIIIPVTLALIAVLFPAIKSWHIKRRLKKLILRELKEINPYPEAKVDGYTWDKHLMKRCIHQEIFKKSSENRDFILSLPPDLVYYLSNLWDPNTQKDPEAKQWLYCLGQLNEYFNRKLDNVHENWNILISEYKKS